MRQTVFVLCFFAILLSVNCDARTCGIDDMVSVTSSGNLVDCEKEYNNSNIRQYFGNVDFSMCISFFTADYSQVSVQSWKENFIMCSTVGSLSMNIVIQRYTPQPASYQLQVARCFKNNSIVGADSCECRMDCLLEYKPDEYFIYFKDIGCDEVDLNVTLAEYNNASNVIPVIQQKSKYLNCTTLPDSSMASSTTYSLYYSTTISSSLYYSITASSRSLYYSTTASSSSLYYSIATTDSTGLIVTSRNDSTLGFVIGSLSFVLMLVIVVAFLMFFLIRKKHNHIIKVSVTNLQENNHTANGADNYTEPRPRKLSEFLSEYNCLIQPKDLKLLEKIGQGEFGIVYRGVLTKWNSKNEPSVTPVAVKTLKGRYSLTHTDQLIEEAHKMMTFNNLNVLRLTGVCLDLLESPCIVMPFMSNGSLLSYLRKQSPYLSVSEFTDEDIVTDTIKQLLSMCLQVAKGMAYLTERKFVHRDLAARNCMISSDGIIKVADFGLTEDLYTVEYFKQSMDSSESVKLPIKWMALESIYYGKFNEKTDVWSYGVFCWEVFTLGRSPYPGLDPRGVVHMLDSGERLDKPRNRACTQEMYRLMLMCWDKSPDNRPAFACIVAEVEKMIKPLADYIDFNLTISVKDNCFVFDNKF